MPSASFFRTRNKAFPTIDSTHHYIQRQQAVAGLGPPLVSSRQIPGLTMGLLQPRTPTVSRSTYVATTVLLVLWIFTLGAIIVYLFRRLRKGALRIERPGISGRPASYDSIDYRPPPTYSFALPLHPQRAHVPSYRPNDGPPCFSANARRTAFDPVRTTSSNIDHVPPDASARTEDFGRRAAEVSPTRNPVAAAASSDRARQDALLARHPSQAAMFARLQAMPLASDTSDLSNDTADAPRETVNASYMAMLADRGIDARTHALVGSDDSTDAGAGTALGYALRARGMGFGSSGAGIEMEMAPGRFLGRGGHGRAMTFG